MFGDTGSSGESLLQLRETGLLVSEPPPFDQKLGRRDDARREALAGVIGSLLHLVASGQAGEKVEAEPGRARLVRA